ncbi:MAG: FAD-dependent oxidoreductase [Thiotrichales bacterium]|nr:FAD-dependent oxidoreductase [Thiotrichales bacterium]
MPSFKTPSNTASRKVAIIGSGISGLSAAWFLSQQHEVTLFEKNAKLGGHTNTTQLALQDKVQPVDTGFIVFNRPNYPNLTAFFKHLNVETQKTEMSFSVSVDGGKLEYSGNNLNTLFAQRRNLLSPSHWQMLREILRFNQQAKKDLNNITPLTFTLGDYLLIHQFSNHMRDNYLLPMAAAIWSCPTETMLKFPVGSFLRFFENHGLLNIEERPQWESVKNGSQQYIDKLLALNLFKTQLNYRLLKVEKTHQKVVLYFENGSIEAFDDVVFASHADQTFQCLGESIRNEFALLSHFKYQENIAYLHSDVALMPKRKLAWAAWNYLKDSRHAQNKVAVTYWMNLLQNFETQAPLLVTLNPNNAPAESLTHQRIVYEHPVFDAAAMRAQKQLSAIQGKHNLWFCGSYFGYGFHEDGLTSAVNLARLWDINLPWESPLTIPQKKQA